MSFFYGNIKNNSSSPFVFDRIYSSRTEMETSLTKNKDETGQLLGDGVFVNRYVLINYGYSRCGGYIGIDNSYVYASDDTDANLFENTENTENHKKRIHYPKDECLITDENVTQFFIWNSSNQKIEQAQKLVGRDYLNASAFYYYKFTNYVEEYYNQQVPYRDLTMTQVSNNNSNNENTNWYFAWNKGLDAQNYQANYHLTVWMKIYSNNVEHYILVGRLKAEPPALAITQCAPSEEPYIDLYQSSDTNYYYVTPKVWDINLLNNNVNINADGFSEEFTNHIAQPKNEIKLIETESGQLYPKWDVKPILLTPDTYRPNWFYIKNEDDTYSLSQGSFDNTATYYMKTQDLTKASIIKKDTKSLDIQLESLGNAVSDLYDTIYGQGQPRRPYNRTTLLGIDGIYNNISDSEQPVSMTWALMVLADYISELRFLAKGMGILGYTNDSKIAGYSLEANDNSNIECFVKKESNNKYYLTIEQIRALSRIQTEDDPYLVYQQNIGLQSDWLLDDINGFGYIYHKPRMLWSDPSYNDSQDYATQLPEDDYIKTKCSIEKIYDAIMIEDDIPENYEGGASQWRKDQKLTLFGAPLNISTPDGS